MMNDQTMAGIMANPGALGARQQRFLQPGPGAQMRAAFAGVNPQQVASWFAQQNPTTQANVLGVGQGGSAQTPWGTIGGNNDSLFKNALLQGGINGNALNQMVNWNAYNAMNPGSPNANAGVFDFTSQGSKYGPSMMDAFGPGAASNPNWSGSDAFNQAHPFNPGAWTGGAGTPQGGAPGGANGAGGGTAPGAGAPLPPATTAGTGMGGLPRPIADGSQYFGPGQLPNGGIINNPNAPNYSLNVGSFLDPSMQFQMDQGLRALQSRASAAGNLLSGDTLKSIVNYSQGLAGTNWNNAVNQAQNQAAFGYGINNADRQFAYNAALADQTIPFQQQMQLAQLGLTGAGGDATTQRLLATLLGQNAIAAGQAAGTGTIGGSNAITGAISQAIANALGQNTLGQILQQYGGPATTARPNG